jgi:hypothetical protein
MSLNTFSLKFNFAKCPMCGSRKIEKKQVNMVCNDCLAQFVRRVDPFNKESLTCIWNRKTDGTLFEPNSTKVFLVPEDPEVVLFT